METPSKPFSLRTKVLYGLFLTGALACFGWFQLFRDEPPRHPPGLVLPEPLPPVADADNGLVYLTDEIEKETWPEFDSGTGGHTEIIHWRIPWNAEKMQPLIEAAPAARTILEKALTFPAWRAESGPGTRSFTSEPQLVQNLIQAQIRHLAETGKLEEAMNWLEPLVQFAERQESTPTSSAMYLIGVGTTRIVDSLTMRLLSLTGVSEAMLEKSNRWLDRPSFDHKIIFHILARDYLAEKARYFDLRDDPKANLGWLIWLMKNGLTTPESPPEWLVKSRFKPQAYHNMLLQHVARVDQLVQMSGPARRIGFKATQETWEHDSKLSVWSLSPTRASQILAGGYVGSYIKMMIPISDSPKAYRDCCRVAIAAKRWSLAHGGQEVKSLTELVPQFLPVVPLDPYDNQPLKWDAATGTVYVLGEDGVDNLPDFKPGEVSAFGKKGVGVRWPNRSGGL